MNTKKEIKLTESKIDDLRKSIDLLVLIELCKMGANRDQARDILGALDNNTFSKVSLVSKRRKNHEK